MIYVVFSDRLGNNLFQLSVALSLSGAVTICVPEIEAYQQALKNSDTFFRDIEILNYIPDGIKVYSEPFFHYSEIPFVSGEDLVIKGYFQSYKYFNREEVLKQFVVPEDVKLSIKENYPEILEGDYTSIHVRRGDYLNVLYKHPVCSLKYYNQAIDIIGKSEKFVVISDDIKWCKKHLSCKNIVFVEDSSAIIDFFIPSFCKNNIISNSSFGWWGAYLNQNPVKLVIAPSPWFGFRNLNDTKDLLPESWVVIPNLFGVYTFARSRIQFLIHHVKFMFGWI